MIKECESIAVERGYDNIVLWVLKDNYVSRKFYESHGYSPEGREEFLKVIDTHEIRYIKHLKD